MRQNEKHWLSEWRRRTAFAGFLVATVLMFALGNSATTSTATSQQSAAALQDKPIAQQQDQVPLIDVEEIDRFDGSPLTWFDDYEAAREIARLTKKPMFVVIRCER